MLQCPRVPGLGYEANFVNEFGDEVGLTSTTTTLKLPDGGVSELRLQRERALVQPG